MKRYNLKKIMIAVSISFIFTIYAESSSSLGTLGKGQQDIAEKAKNDSKKETVNIKPELQFLRQKTTEQKTNNSAEAIDLEADSGVYDQLAGHAVYKGNVSVKQGVTSIKSDELIIKLKNNAAEKLIAKGNKKTPVKFAYKGNVQPIYGEADRVEYTILSKTVVLIGKAIIRQGKDTIRGDKLNYDLSKEIIKADRIKMVIHPIKRK